MRAKRPGANGNRSETTHGANRFRGEMTRIQFINVQNICRFGIYLVLTSVGVFRHLHAHGGYTW
jgi:hypothetical protein